MNKRKVSYCPCWETSYSWIKKDNRDCAHCSVCKRSFRINNSGLPQVKGHASRTGHEAKKVWSIVKN